ncbi:hypothetical protein UVI_02040020 [Ustilaginoidea virens]|nr:hypothetical protein UVI_02040020 [Ustilaginoidea virens]
MAVDILAKYDGEVAGGKHFEEAYKKKSIFHFTSLGSGGLFAKMASLTRNANRVGGFHSRTRDAAAIAYACREINHVYYDPAFWKAMKELDFDFKSVVDLGCGSGERLMEILGRYPGACGLGVDIAMPSLQVAISETAERGLSDRLSFVEGNVLALEYRDEFSDVDLLTCFMMGHDFWPRENCIKTLQWLRQAFPKVRRFLLGDAHRLLLNSRDQGEPPTHAVDEHNVPFFSLAFEAAHALMDVYVPTIDEWEGVFEAGGWRCVRKHLIETADWAVVFELEHA